jgi:hypothetical protein
MTGILVLCFVVGATAGALVAGSLVAHFWRGFDKSPGGLVEQYRLTVDRSDPFAKVLVTFETAKGRATYEFQPAYAYVLSNELCRISVQSAPRDERPGEERAPSSGIVSSGLPPEGEL